MLPLLLSLSLLTTPLPLALVAPPTPAPAAPSIPKEVFVSEKPKDAKPVADAKKSAKKGDTVVIEGEALVMVPARGQ
jgi:hypothetical protein